MTVSKILLGAGIAVLAIAGAVTTKAGTQTFTYYYQQTPTSCVSEILTKQCPNAGLGCVDLQGHQLYQSINPTTGQCETTLKLQ